MKLWLGSFLNYLFNDIITHVPIHFIRLGFLRLFNKEISREAKILLHVKILNFWEVEIGPRSVINQYCLLDCRLFKIFIKNDVDIGPYTRIWTLGHDPDNENHSVKGGNVIIEDHVWIASGVTLLPDITIGRGAVLASGSVVTKSTESLGIYGGNPARKIKDRNNSLDYSLNFTPIFQ
jgi:maltose O-acetyltransferase